VYKNVLLPNQMGADGSFPLETWRAPNLMAILFLTWMQWLMHCARYYQRQPMITCGNMKQPTVNLSVKESPSYILLLRIKINGALPPDVMYWNNWPVAQPFLLFGANNFNESNGLKPGSNWTISLWWKK
jgi:hypothetical protein